MGASGRPGLDWAGRGGRGGARCSRVRRVHGTPRRKRQYGPWHPGRCAELAVVVEGVEQVIGHAGELHPGVLKTLAPPARTSAMELDLDVLESASSGVPRARRSPRPGRHADVALVVDARSRTRTSRRRCARAGELLESIRLFDVYDNAAQLGEGKKSLAYAPRFRAADRTLTVDEASAARDAAVALAAGAQEPC
ncbi:hypothetical protein ACRAWF_18135 [Streptomyces sp. L7]